MGRASAKSLSREAGRQPAKLPNRAAGRVPVKPPMNLSAKPGTGAYPFPAS